MITATTTKLDLKIYRALARQAEAEGRPLAEIAKEHGIRHTTHRMSKRVLLKAIYETVRDNEKILEALGRL